MPGAVQASTSPEATWAGGDFTGSWALGSLEVARRQHGEHYRGGLGLTVSEALPHIRCLQFGMNKIQVLTGLLPNSLGSLSLLLTHKVCLSSLLLSLGVR